MGCKSKVIVYDCRNVPGGTFAPDAIDGLGLVIVALVGLAVGASATIVVEVFSKTCRIISMAFPIVGSASSAVNPVKAAIGILSSLDSNEYPGKRLAGEIFITLRCV